MTGRVQAHSLGESFAEQYGFSLMNESHIYEIEYGGISFSTCSEAAQNRVEETARWFTLGFWGINASSHTSFLGVAETPGTSPLSSCQ